MIVGTLHCKKCTSYIVYRLDLHYVVGGILLLLSVPIALEVRLLNMVLLLGLGGRGILNYIFFLRTDTGVE